VHQILRTQARLRPDDYRDWLATALTATLL